MKLSDLKVGDKFRFASRTEAGECVLVGEARKRPFDGMFEWAYWSETLGYKHTTGGESEVELITDPPKPKYRPFANAEEFAPHRDRWLREAAIKRFITLTMYDSCGVWHDGTQTRIDWKTLYEDYTFDDGTPCGELVE